MKLLYLFDVFYTWFFRLVYGACTDAASNGIRVSDISSVSTASYIAVNYCSNTQQHYLLLFIQSVLALS